MSLKSGLGAGDGGCVAFAFCTVSHLDDQSASRLGIITRKDRSNMTVTGQLLFDPLARPTNAGQSLPLAYYNFLSNRHHDADAFIRMRAFLDTHPRNSIVTPARVCTTLAAMDKRAIRRAALVTLRRAICERFAAGAERRAWLRWASRLAA
jgi:hypothetical protein